MPTDKLFFGVVGVYYPAVRDLVGMSLKMFLNVVEHLRPLSRCIEGTRGPPRAAVVVVAVPAMRPWLTHVHALFSTEGRCALQNVLGRRRGTCHADGVPRTRLLAPVEVEFPWVFVAASGATVHGAIVHSNAKVFLVDITMPFRSDAETDWIHWYCSRDLKTKAPRSNQLLKTCTCEDRVWRYVIIYVYIHTYIYPRIR